MSNPYPPYPPASDPWGRQGPQQSPYPGGPAGPGQGGGHPAPGPNPYQQGGYPPPQPQPYPQQQGGYPGVAQQGHHPQQGTGQAQLVLDLKYFPLAWIFAFVKPKVTLNGHQVNAQWGVNAFPLPAGQHHIHVHVPYFLPSQVGPADLQLPLQPGQTAHVEYRAPLWAFSGGSIGPAPQQWNGVGITVAVMVIPFVFVFMVFFLALIASA